MSVARHHRARFGGVGAKTGPPSLNRLCHATTGFYTQGTGRRLIVANKDRCKMAKRGDDVFKESGSRDEQGYGIGGWDVRCDSISSEYPPSGSVGRLHCMVGQMDNSKYKIW